MEVQEDDLEKLVCDYCGEYLSIGPITLLDKERSVCGRCFPPDPKEQTVLRNLPYELLAKEVLFPCQNKRYGCTTKLRFNTLKSHEATCDYRQYTCFLLETRSCNWFGAKKDILKHCKAKHPDQELINPAVIKHDIVQQSVKNFLMTAFNLLFLIHIKVCLQTRKIYHCVRLLGDFENIKDYSFILDICQERNKLIKTGQVFPQGCLSIKESDSISVGINNLIDIFNGFAGITFKLTVICIVQEITFKRKWKGNSLKEMSCDKCKTSITYELAYYDENKWKCANCVERKEKWRFKQNGCKFKSTFNKSMIHSWFYCNYRTTCGICNSTIRNSINEHYDIDHFNITYLAGVAFTERVSRYMYKNLIITSDVGKLHCSHVLHDSKFQFFISSSLDSGELHYYALELEFRNSATKFILYKNASIYNSNTHFSDWHIEIKQEEFVQCVTNSKFILTLTITKIKNHIKI